MYSCCIAGRRPQDSHKATGGFDRVSPVDLGKTVSQHTTNLFLRRFSMFAFGKVSVFFSPPVSFGEKHNYTTIPGKAAGQKGVAPALQPVEKALRRAPIVQSREPIEDRHVPGRHSSGRLLDARYTSQPGAIIGVLFGKIDGFSWSMESNQPEPVPSTSSQITSKGCLWAQFGTFGVPC